MQSNQEGYRVPCRQLRHACNASFGLWGEQMSCERTDLVEFMKGVQGLSTIATNLKLDFVKYLLEMALLELVEDCYGADESIFFVD